jgi:hypothetical protein
MKLKEVLGPAEIQELRPEQRHQLGHAEEVERTCLRMQREGISRKDFRELGKAVVANMPRSRGGKRRPAGEPTPMAVVSIPFEPPGGAKRLGPGRWRWERGEWKRVG